jgi:hypothetical protein
MLLNGNTHATAHCSNAQRQRGCGAYQLNPPRTLKASPTLGPRRFAPSAAAATSAPISTISPALTTNSGGALTSRGIVYHDPKWNDVETEEQFFSILEVIAASSHWDRMCICRSKHKKNGVGGASTPTFCARITRVTATAPFTTNHVSPCHL